MRRKGIKPFFVRHLPQRLEIFDGQDFEMTCNLCVGGCKPGFIRTLPGVVTIAPGSDLEVKCLAGKNHLYEKDYKNNVLINLEKETMESDERKISRIVTGINIILFIIFAHTKMCKKLIIANSHLLIVKNIANFHLTEF